MLRSHLTDMLIEAGCDEAGRGCLAGPVFAAAVILPRSFSHETLTDSKLLTAKQRNSLRPVIKENAISWAVARVDAPKIDEINILNASILAMHIAIQKLTVIPELLLIDGNRFKPVFGIVHKCIVRGDSIFLSIAAASILAKTYRDEYMQQIHHEFPEYDWHTNKGYPVKKHREAIRKFGLTPYHRLSFRCEAPETNLINNSPAIV
ncbi:MAG: ribonuclease HII [Bacteroidetes bacterium]|nr:ribonuclease HII [Bacteroidota bacterium]